MFKIVHRVKGFNIAEVWFAPEPFDVGGVSRASFYWCASSQKNFRGFEAKESYYPVIDLSKSIEDIKKGFKKNTRNEITRAGRENLKVNYESVNKRVADFHNDFIRRKRLNFPKISPKMFEATRHISVNVYSGNKLLVSHIFIIENDLVWLLLIASGQKSTLTGIASAYANYKLIEWAKSNGYMRFSLSSIGDDPDNLDSIAKFKVGFSKDIVKRYMYTKYYNPLLKAVVNKIGRNRP